MFAAQHEVENLSPAAARALLQRGIRLNKENVTLWSEYVKFELGFVEGLRRRWDVLGVGEEESDEARKEIMQGAIVKTVIGEAVKGAANVHACERVWYSHKVQPIRRCLSFARCRRC